MGNFIDLTGLVYGKLTVIKRVANTTKSSHAHWECICECGNKTIATSGHLKTGFTKSCGCMEGFRKHNMSGSRPYSIWRHMLKRCNDVKDDNYRDYGGRGISVCEKWHAFEGFWEDMKNGYSNDLTLDRINNNGNYEKKNCRWTDRFTQCNNTRRNITLEYNGETKTMSEWVRKTGIGWKTIEGRLKRGWTVERALTTMPSKKP